MWGSPWADEALSPGSFGPMSPIGVDGSTSAALGYCQPLDLKLQQLSSRVQKLERSRGQINKDISDMLRECQYLHRREPVDGHREEAKQSKKISSPAAKDDKQDTKAGYETTLPIPMPLTRSVTAPVPNSGSTVHPAKGALTPPPGLQTFPPIAATQEAPQLIIEEEQVGGRTVHRVKWRIDRLETKFRECIGRPVSSKPFEVNMQDKVQLPELRLMVFPNLGTDSNVSTMKEQKSRFEALIKEEGLTGALKLKVVNNFGDRLMISFNLFVGSMKQGPLTHDFADRIIHGCDFNQNWLKEQEDGSLTVGVEILGVNEDG